MCVIITGLQESYLRSVLLASSDRRQVFPTRGLHTRHAEAGKVVTRRKCVCGKLLPSSMPVECVCVCVCFAPWSGAQLGQCHIEAIRRPAIRRAHACCKTDRGRRVRYSSSQCWSPGRQLAIANKTRQQFQQNPRRARLAWHATPTLRNSASLLHKYEYC